MSLYQKYRPTCLSEMLGNKLVLENLAGLLATPDPPHAYLLTGPSGCGKTTLGRIISTTLGVSPEDYHEVDSADFRGIEVVRDIRHKANYKALKGTRRAWLLDEVHQLPAASQSALLKGLEEPPSHCYYVLCTTDPDKLLTAIKGRCVAFGVKELSEQQIMRLMVGVINREGAAVDREVLHAIYEKTSGHARNALQLLETVLATPVEDRIKVVEEAEAVREMVTSLAKALLNRQGWPAIRQTLATIKPDDIESVRRGLLGYCERVLLNTENDRAAEIMDVLREPFFATGRPGLVFACYTAHKM